MANEYLYFATGSNNYAWQEEGIGEYTSLMGFGWDQGENCKLHGAVRIASLPINKDTYIYSADLTLNDIYRTGNSIYFKVYGIDEDNTGDFGNPFGRSRTSAESNLYEYEPSSRMGCGVTDQVREITTRSGWSSGNAIGFLFIDQDSSNHGSQSNYILCDDIWLKIKFAAEPNFKPTPVTLNSASFPATDSIGIKISKPGVDVKTASESDLYFTTRKKTMAVKSQGLITTTANPHNLSHGLSYIPMVMAFALKDGKRHILPRVRYGAGDSIGYVATDKSNVKFYVPIGTDVYYYIFYDPQPV